jgi:hypothetical protein
MLDKKVKQLDKYEKLEIKKDKDIKRKKMMITMLIVVLSIVALLVGMFFSREPKYEYPKKMSSYSLEKVHETADTAATALFKSIYTEDTQLCADMINDMSKYTVMKVFGQIKQKRLTDEEFEEIFKNANKNIKEIYGENWFDNVSIIDVEKYNGLSTVKMECNGKMFMGYVYATPIEGEYYIPFGNVYNILMHNNGEN